MACFLTLGRSRYVWRLGVVIFGYRLPNLGSPRCNQGTETELCKIVFLKDTAAVALFSQIKTGMDHVHKNDCNYLISQTKDAYCPI